MNRLLLALLLLVSSAHSATYYVDVGGSDAAAGTSWETAWATTSKAASTAAAGDTVYFGAGTWTTVLNVTGNGVTWDGLGQATIRNITVSGATNVFQNLRLSGYMAQYNYHAELLPGAHWNTFQNMTIVCSTNYQGGFRQRLGEARPFDDTEASNCTFVSNTVYYISGEFAAFSTAGTNNLIAYNVITNGIKLNAFYPFGRWNTFRGNRVQGGSPDPTTMGWPTVLSGHPDFIQVWGKQGEGAKGHLFENNILLGDWTPELQSTNSILAGGTVSGGQFTLGEGMFALAFEGGATHYDGSGAAVITNIYKISSSPFRFFFGPNDGSLTCGTNYLTDDGIVWSGPGIGTPETGFATLSGTPNAPITITAAICAWWEERTDVYGGWVFRNNIFANTKGSISFGLPNSTWQNNIFYQIAYGLSGHALTMGVTPYRNDANFFSVHNNIFLDCGYSDTAAWYNIGSVTHYTADHNLVRRAGGPVREENPPSAFRWYEPNGLNGDDPLFVNLNQLQFRPIIGSPVIDAGTNVLAHDISGWSRPMGSGVDIGPYEVDPNLQAWYDFDQSFSDTNHIEDITGYGRHAFFPMETNLDPSLANWADWSDLDFDGWPDPPMSNRPSIALSADGSTAGRWGMVASITNDPPRVYGVSQYAAVTNISDGIEFMTNGTLALWVRWGTIEQGAVRRSTVLHSGGHGYWGYAANAALATNSWGLGYGPYAPLDQSPTGPMLWRNEESTSYPTVLVQWTHSRDDSTWYHIAATWTANGDVIGYQNGSPIVTNSFPYPYLRVAGRAVNPFGAIENIAWLTIGADNHGGSLTWGDDKYPNDSYFVGTMDDLRLWNRDLSHDEILLVYGATALLSPADPDAPESPSPPWSAVLRASTLRVGTIRAP